VWSIGHGGIQWEDETSRMIQNCGNELLHIGSRQTCVGR
jgi:hypothetical protein